MNHVLAATVTVLPPATRGAVLVCGSHGGRYPGALALLAGVRAAIFNDAGIGLDEAGVASLPLMQGHGVAGAAVSHASCRIGDAEDLLARGVVSRCNGAARALGLRPGMACAEAAERLAAAPLRVASVAKPAEARAGWPAPAGSRRIALLDSAALVDAETDHGAIIVTGSHGGLVGGSAAKALKADAFAAFFNDAGIGMEEAGTTRLPALDQRGIAGLVVAASSARIGEARSTLVDGVVSRLNETARRLGAREGERALALVTRWSRGHHGP